MGRRNKQIKSSFIIKAIEFRRDENSEPELGVTFDSTGDADLIIFDRVGNRVSSPIYDGHDRLDILCIDIGKLLNT